MAYAVPGYSVPSRTTFSRNYVPQLYDRIRKKIQAIILLDMKDCLSMSLTTDGWRSRSGDCYISLTIHYLDSKMLYRHFTLGNQQIRDQHTASNLRMFLSDMLECWSIPPTVSFPIYVVTDNARNITSAISGHQTWVHRKCFAHTLQLAISDAKKHSDILPILKTVRSIVGHYNSSDPARRSLLNMQKEMNLPDLHVVQDIETRWNSELAMLKRLLQLKAPISRCMINDDTVATLSGSDWKTISELVDILEPLDQATTFSSGVIYPTASMIIPLVTGITGSITSYLDKTEDTHSSARRFAQELNRFIKSRFAENDVDFVSKTSMILDPRFKTILMNEITVNLMQQNMASEYEKTRDHRNDVELLNEDIAGPSRSTNEGKHFWSFMDSLSTEDQTTTMNDPSLAFKLELKNYLREPLLDNSADVYNWWSTQGVSKFPCLSRLARKFLPIPATSVPSERMFSTAGNIVTTRRENLLPKHVDQLTFLHDNLNHIDN